MTRVDPSRIAEIFRSLSNESGNFSVFPKSASQQESVNVGSVLQNKRYDHEVLRQRLRKRLKRLNAEMESGSFLGVAKEVTIKEVLIWEFGDEITNHPEFNSIANKIVDTMQNNKGVSIQLQQLIEQMVS